MKVKKHFSIFIIMGLVYLVMEVFNRWVGGAMVGYEIADMTQSMVSATGWTSFWMLLVGGLCGLLLGKMNEWKCTNKLPVLVQAIIGTLLIVLPLEFSSGIILNIWLKLGIWDYSNNFANLLGQICLQNGLMFMAICPFAFWLDDVLRHYIYDEKKPSPLYKFYVRIFTDFAKIKG